MSGSDYERLSLNRRGRPIKELKTASGVVAEIYKNWVYIRDPKAWRPGRFIEPTIAEFRRGYMEYRDLNLLAEPMPGREGIFCAAWTCIGTELRGMVGIGVYAWRNAAHVALRKMGREILPGERWEGSYFGGPDGSGFELRRMNLDYEVLEEISAEAPSDEELWAGIEPADIEGLREFLRGDGVPRELREVKIPCA